MHNLRSRAAFAGMTTVAAALLALPVVALGQVPGVDQVVGGVNQAAQDVVQAAPAPPVKLPAPAVAPKPAPAVAAPAPAASAPSAPAPASARSAPAITGQASGGSGGITRAHARSGKRPKANGGGSGVRVHAAAHKRASKSGATVAETDTQIADDPASVPRDASPASLPFTGLQLGLLLLAGLAAVAAGSVIRRTARP